MLPGPNEIIKCTNCDCIYVRRTILSGNTFGGVRFSDGSAFYPMLPQYPLIVNCSKCKKNFWVKDVSQMGSYGWDEDIPDKWQNAEELTFPLIEEYQLALDEHIFINDDEETYIRKQIWWMLNGKKRKAHLSNEEIFFYNQNTLRLLELINPSVQENIILITELYRNLGRFDEAKEMIDKLNDKHYSEIKQKFITHIKNKNTNTFQL